MEWVTDPAALLGFTTLVILEIVLGIDNLVFISIMTEKLPPKERDIARFIGLSLALIMRVGLLLAISWITNLTTPLLVIMGKAFSGRDLILLGGGIFLLFKATIELHDRISGCPHEEAKAPKYISFWSVIVQIILLDLVFSVDSIITAIGMVDDTSIMISAVIIAVIVMMVSAKPLTRLINDHPTLIILCLAFLLMIGFSLVVEGFGFDIPKGYLYCAIAFSLMTEFLNHLVREKAKTKAR